MNYGVQWNFQKYFIYTIAVSSIGRGNWSIQRKPPICNTSLILLLNRIHLVKGWTQTRAIISNMHWIRWWV